MDNVDGGLCATKNLKLKIHIQGKYTDVKSNSSFEVFCIHSTFKRYTCNIGGHRHLHTKKRNHHTSAGRNEIKQQAETTTSAAYWDEFLHKFHNLPAASDGTDRQDRLHETVALDTSLNGDKNDFIYERSDASYSQALRLDPKSILYEIHEFDESSASSIRSFGLHTIVWLNLKLNMTALKVARSKRRRVTLAQRRAANERERRRMTNIGMAFKMLQSHIPTFCYERSLTRIETLK
uniref:BHLH domain-containing protein n=1 Tax=Syphacia muris TaxID=451379 RepID=A0A0N5B0A3_9BILA